MMLTTKIENAEISGKTTTQSFDIGDPTMIIEFMSKTIYSNPLKVSIQEYSTNARDAHIEIGLENTPITIICPNRFDNMLKICDSGPGIDPVRMKEVFLRYGCSTKRKDNKQGGGFGLGGKSFIAYTDTFNIRTTTVDENGDLVLRNYSVIKEFGKAPRLIEFGNCQIININDPNTKEEDKHSGTIISAIIKPEDFEACKNHIINITKFWKIRPIIKGCFPELVYPEFKWAYEGTNWKIGFDYDYNTQSFICIDGIPYPLDRNAIHDLAVSVGVNDICKTNFVLFFEVGELSVSLSRESLQYDDETKKAIVQRLTEMKSWLNKNLQKQIETSASLWDAIVLYKKLNSVFSTNQIVGEVFWNGIKVSTDKVLLHFGTGRRYFYENKLISLKIKSKREYSLDPSDGIVFTVNNETKFHIGKIATLLDQNPGKEVFVYFPEDSFALNKLKSKVSGFDDYKPTYLSTVIKKKMPKIINPNPAPRSPRFLMKDTLIVTADNKKFGDNSISYKDDSGYFAVSTRYSLYNGVFNTVEQIQEFLKKYAPTETVYIIKSKYEDKISKNFVKFQEIVKKVFEQEIGKVNLAEYHKYNNSKRYLIDWNDCSLMKFIRKNIASLDGTFLKDWNDLSIKKTTAKDKIENEDKYIINIGGLLKDNRIADTTNDADIIELKKYDDLFSDRKEKFNRIFNYREYWNTTNKLQKEIDVYYLEVIKKIFVE